jgi:hypothetical protein
VLSWLPEECCSLCKYRDNSYFFPYEGNVFQLTGLICSGTGAKIPEHPLMIKTRDFVQTDRF